MAGAATTHETSGGLDAASGSGDPDAEARGSRLRWRAPRPEGPPVELPEHDPVARLCAHHPALAALWRWRVLLLVLAATLLGLVIGFRSRPAVLYDDAAITMRYASRIADGQGWTYNPGDRTNGASAPLYTMVLAALDWVGINVVTAARLVGTAAFAATFGLVALLGSRIIGLGAGILATGILASWVDFHVQGLSGMESVLAAALGLGAIAALREDRDVLAGVLLGLAVVNKIDAGLLAVAVALAYVGVLRRAPWRLVVASVVVALPWFAFATAYFGSPLPYSFTQKSSGSIVNPAADMSPTWMLEGFQAQKMVGALLLGLAAVAILPWLARRVPRAAVALGVAVAWPVLHGLAFSFTDLGDRYSWYFVVLYPPLALAGGCLLGAAIGAARRSSGLAVAVVCLATASVAALAVGLHRPDGGAPVTVAKTIANGRVMGEYEAFENARREAARQLAAMAQPGDVILTCYGWYAFEAEQAVILESCPLNTREPVGPPRWYGAGQFPGFQEPEVSASARHVLTVRSEVGQGGRADVYEFTEDITGGS